MQGVLWFRNIELKNSVICYKEIFQFFPTPAVAVGPLTAMEVPFSTPQLLFDGYKALG